MKAEAADFFRVVLREAAALTDPMELVYPGEVPIFDKYDELLPAELVRKGFACGVLDIEGMKERVASWAGFIPQELPGENPPDASHLLQ